MSSYIQNVLKSREKYADNYELNKPFIQTDTINSIIVSLHKMRNTDNMEIIDNFLISLVESSLPHPAIYTISNQQLNVKGTTDVKIALVLKGASDKNYIKYAEPYADDVALYYVKHFKNYRMYIALDKLIGIINTYGLNDKTYERIMELNIPQIDKHIQKSNALPISYIANKMKKEGTLSDMLAFNLSCGTSQDNDMVELYSCFSKYAEYCTRFLIASIVASAESRLSEHLLSSMPIKSAFSIVFLYLIWCSRLAQQSIAMVLN
jgi:hypothetical protein